MIIQSHLEEDITIYFHKIFYPGEIKQVKETDFFTLNDPNILYRYFSALTVDEEYLFLFNNNDDLLTDKPFDNLKVVFQKPTDCLLNDQEKSVESIYLQKKDIIIFSGNESFKVNQL